MTGKFNSGKKALGAFLKIQRNQGIAEMKHEILEIEPCGNIVIMRGQVTGIYHPNDKSPSIAFKTKNLFVFQATEGTLKIKKVIYNSAPLD